MAAYHREYCTDNVAIKMIDRYMVNFIGYILIATFIKYICMNLSFIIVSLIDTTAMSYINE